MKKQDKQLEKILFEVYDKGVKQKDCNLTECIANVKQTLHIHDVSGRCELLAISALQKIEKTHSESYSAQVARNALK